MAERKSEPGPSYLPPDGGFIEIEQFGLSHAFQALASPITRHFIELIAIEPRSKNDLGQHFDLTPAQISTAASLLVQAGFARPGPGVDDIDDCLHLDNRALDLIRLWLDRIASCVR